MQLICFKRIKFRAMSATHRSLEAFSAGRFAVNRLACVFTTSQRSGGISPTFFTLKDTATLVLQLSTGKRSGRNKLEMPRSPQCMHWEWDHLRSVGSLTQCFPKHDGCCEVRSPVREREASQRVLQRRTRVTANLPGGSNCQNHGSIITTLCSCQHSAWGDAEPAAT